MTQGQVMDLMQSAILVALKLTAPMLLVSIAIGLVVAIFQAATQIHEQTLTFVPKILALAVLLLVMGSWMMTVMNDFVNELFTRIAAL